MEVASKSSSCISYKDNQYKILMFWYHTLPSLLHSIFPDVPDVCWSWEGGATLFHVFLGLSPSPFILEGSTAPYPTGPDSWDSVDFTCLLIECPPLPTWSQDFPPTFTYIDSRQMPDSCILEKKALLLPSWTFTHNLGLSGPWNVWLPLWLIDWTLSTLYGPCGIIILLNRKTDDFP